MAASAPERWMHKLSGGTVTGDLHYYSIILLYCICTICKEIRIRVETECILVLFTIFSSLQVCRKDYFTIR